jgi:hypothetical protein
MSQEIEKKVELEQLIERSAKLIAGLSGRQEFRNSVGKREELCRKYLREMAAHTYRDAAQSVSQTLFFRAIDEMESDPQKLQTAIAQFLERKALEVSE